MTLILTPNQEKTYHHLNTLSHSFPVIIIQGEKESGKHVIVEKFFATLKGYKIITIDLCSISLQKGTPLQPSNFYHHLFSQVLALNEPVWVYIRHWNKIREIIEDYNIDYRYFPRYALSRFTEQLSVDKKQLIITTEADANLETNNFWLIKHEIKTEDIRYLLTREFLSSEVDKLLPFVKKAKPGQLNQIMSYVRAFPDEDLLTKFKEAAVKVCGSTLDPEETVTVTAPDINLIGMENILKAIEVAIIFPMEFGSDEIPLKKGIVLSGPPGTGKTSIGRWLAYCLRGKLYLVDGSAGASGNNFISHVLDTIEQAYRNAPAVVFIDDVDTLFENNDNYRSFLTLLDGLENKYRGGICVIVTCMDITKIPSSLIRGGRLELCLETKLPDMETREKIIRLGFDKMLLLLTRFEEEKKISPVTTMLRNELTPRWIRELSGRMGNWNCADIQRSLDDILRSILARKGKDITSIKDIATEVIEAIKNQYKLVRRPEEKPDTSMWFV